MTRTFIRLLALLFAIAFLSTNSTIFIYAEGIEESEDCEECEHYNALIKATNREELTFDETQWLFGDGDKITGIISAEEVKAFNQGTASFSFGIDVSQILEQHQNSPEFDLYAAFVLYEGAGKFYTCEFSVLDDPVIAADEIRKTAKSGLRGIDRERGGLMDSDGEKESDMLSGNTKITGIQIFELMDFNREWLEDQPSDYTTVVNGMAFIQKVAVIDSSESGWREYKHDRWNANRTAREDVDLFYVKKNGTLATSSLTIDGIRYKFDQSGVCQGKYTGYTMSSKGKRYWKNGELVKNRWIKVKGERKYYADKNGYLVTGTRKINGKKYSFDESGALKK